MSRLEILISAVRTRIIKQTKIRFIMFTKGSLLSNSNLTNNTQDPAGKSLSAPITAEPT